jgi:hypothetical protein
MSLLTILMRNCQGRVSALEQTSALMRSLAFVTDSHGLHARRANFERNLEPFRSKH